MVLLEVAAIGILLIVLFLIVRFRKKLWRFIIMFLVTFFASAILVGILKQIWKNISIWLVPVFMIIIILADLWKKRADKYSEI